MLDASTKDYVQVVFPFVQRLVRQSIHTTKAQLSALLYSVWTAPPPTDRQKRAAGTRLKHVATRARLALQCDRAPVLLDDGCEGSAPRAKDTRCYRHGMIGQQCQSWSTFAHRKAVDASIAKTFNLVDGEVCGVCFQRHLSNTWV
jgi:hypothetical protein